ncbi:PKD domain-containing protein [Flavitalea sp. BT771]|uniref:PKD domain-containing protein n=1 Tax=Flavitalea sp. BT771 TaxID=3063329 RepID=UPI0026E1BA42|nr:PKD domain-containing protein [Flavitalea sp. BT771]MDO6431877.1 PKD domain-containing protein [Flavitalea sp. BT771]MDV6220786.1 PKD domain-containing protein [Flavitalea sp. BT771]
MKGTLLRYSSWRRALLPLCFFLLASLLLSAQSETHDFITYDTVIQYHCFPPNQGMDGCTGNKFILRISRPRNYFTAGNADTASRPWILTMPGRGEVKTPPDTNQLTVWGPHYWLQHGWDGGVQLNNGKHYPILVTVIASSADVRPWFVQALMDTLIRIYHPRNNSLHMAGLSMGVEVLGWYLGYEMTAGDEHNMANVRSFVDLEGQSPGDYFGSSPMTYPSFFGHWAKKYGGRFFGLAGSQDSNPPFEISENMNDSLSNTAYFSYESYGGGGHCCWNAMYDPSVTNWRCVAPVTNPNLGPPYYLHPATMGTYYVDPTTGTNIFQWMLRQGDTTLVTSSPPANQLPVANAGPDKSIRLPLDSVVVTGSGTDSDGTIVSYAWTKASGTGGTITAPSSATTTFKGLTAGVYKFALTVTDNNGGTGTDTMQVTVDTAYIPPTVTAGPDKFVTLPIDSVVLNGNATGHGTTIHILTWTTTSGPNSPTIVMTNSNMTATIHGLIQGTYIFTLTATDNHGLTSTDSVTVTVNPTPAAKRVFVAPGEYQVFFIDTAKHLYAIGTNLVTQGVGGTGTPGTILPVAVPSNLTFKTAAGCLHGGAAVDNNGNVWAWGDNDQGQVGNGATSTQVLTPVQITTDSAGNAFTGVTTLCAYYSGNVSQGWYAVKSDSTLWVWGQTLGGMRGNGTTGSTALTRPAQVPIPGNRKVMQIAAGNQLIVLCSDSTVWTCGGSNTLAQNLGYAATGNDYLTLHQLTTLSGIKLIAGGASFNYALKSNGTLYGWGYYGHHLGGTGGVNASPLATPTDLTSRLNLPHPVKAIAVDFVCTHAILSDSTLWGWGDNAQGGIGIGTELNFATTTDPYAWDYYPTDLLQQAPVQVTTRKDFVAIYTAQPFVMFDYAQTADGQLYSWGRNKGGVLGNGIVGCSSDVVAKYPNSWDVTTPTPVNPLSVTSTTVGPCPYCVAHPTTSPCNGCSTGSAIASAAKTNTAAGLTTDGTGHTPSQFQVYPSVAQDNQELHLMINSDKKGPLLISLYDMNGKLVKILRLNKPDAYFNQTFNTGHLPAGTYVVKALIGDSGQLIAKFIRL